MHNDTFTNMGIKPRLLQMIDNKGFELPTPIQVKAIPPALAGHDVMGQAQTGTGKTAAFAIPMLNQMVPGRGLQGLVVCPTRELAVQVTEEINSLGKGVTLRTLAVYGGQSIDLQIRSLKHQPELVVGTPGRLIDHLQRGNISLANLAFLVLDEADEMLDMGFLPDIERIMSSCPAERQTFLFSATLNEEIRKLGSQFMHEPEVILIESPELTVPLTRQYFLQVNPRYKMENFCRLLDVEQPTVSLVFCRTKRGVDALARSLVSRGFGAEALHGDMTQRERDYVMESFRKGSVSILVATDLAARGLDVELVSHVFNYDIPEDPDSYVHRIGRTGRAGRDGIAITFVEPRQTRQLRIIEQHIGKKMIRRNLPTLKDALASKQESLNQRLLATTRENLDIYQEMASELLAGNNAQTLLAAAIKIIASGEPSMEFTDVENSNYDTVHVELPLGRVQGINPRRLVEFLSANTSLTPRQIGDIEIHSNTSYVEVPMPKIDEVCEAFNNFEPSRKNHRPRFGVPRSGRSKKAN